MAAISTERKLELDNEFRETIRAWSPEELAWDFHCNIGEDARGMIRQEARRRGINLCKVRRIRTGGPFVEGMTWHKEPCGGCNL